MIVNKYSDPTGEVFSSIPGTADDKANLERSSWTFLGSFEETPIPPKVIRRKWKRPQYANGSRCEFPTIDRLEFPPENNANWTPVPGSEVEE